MRGRGSRENSPSVEQMLADAFEQARADPVGRARRLLDVITGFLGESDDEIVWGNALPELQAGLEDAAREFADEALVVLSGVVERGGRVSESSVTAVLRAWIARPDEGAFPNTWATASRVLPPGVHRSRAAEWYRLLDRVLRGMPGQAVSPVFRRLVITHLVGKVDARFEEFALSASPIWQLLYVLGPDARATWFCVLGDRAAERGDEVAAARRYQLALDKGCWSAGPRLARLLAVEGYRLLGSGDAAGAVRKLDAALKLADEPDYRALRAAASLSRGAPSRLALEEILAQTERVPSSAPLALTAAWALMLAGRREDAVAPLRALVDTRPAGSDLAANVRLVLGVLTGDDNLLVDGGRHLLDQHPEGWADRSVVGAAPVLAAAARRDPVLFFALASGTKADIGRELVVTAGRRALVDAVRAALAGRAGDAHDLLVLAGRVLGEAGATEDARVAELTVVIDRVGRHVGRLGELPDELAYAALRDGGVVFPWTERAELIWDAAAADPAAGSRTHHAALVHHAHAYDLELTTDAAAFWHWRTALDHWLRLRDDDPWWERKRRHLIDVLPNASPAEIDQVVDEVREEFVGDLLQPHRVLATRLQHEDPARARQHMTLVRGVPPRRSRKRRQQPELYTVAEAVDQKRFEEALADLEPRLLIDPHNLDMVVLALEIGRRWSEYTYDVDDWGRWNSRAALLLGRVRVLVDPACDHLGLNPTRVDPATERDDDLANLVRELARYEFWWGYHQWLKATVYLSGRKFDALVEALQVSLAHLRLVKKLTENSGTDGIYAEVDKILANALDLEGQCRRLEQDPYWRPYRFGFR